MADTTKLSVGKALEKLSGTDEQKSKATRLDEKIDDADKEAQRLGAMSRSLGPSRPTNNFGHLCQRMWAISGHT
jgi:hypothetical protein